MKRITALLSWSLMFLFASHGVAQAYSLRDAVHPDYPGYCAETDEAVPYARELVLAGAEMFYRVHGRWPASFAEVRQSGLVQTELYGYQLQPIDPDDRRLDCAGDVTFAYNPEQASISVSWLDFAGRPQFDTLRRGPETITALMNRAGQAAGADFTAQAGDSTLLRTYGVASMLLRGAATFQTLHHRSPRSWSELAASGLAGLDTASLCPWNGLPLDGSGGARGIRLRFGEQACSVSITDEQGRTLSPALIF